MKVIVLSFFSTIAPTSVELDVVDGFIDSIEFLVALFKRLLVVRCGSLFEEAAHGYPNLVACENSFGAFW